MKQLLMSCVLCARFIHIASTSTTHSTIPFKDDGEAKPSLKFSKVIPGPVGPCPRRLMLPLTSTAIHQGNTGPLPVCQRFPLQGVTSHRALDRARQLRLCGATTLSAHSSGISTGPAPQGRVSSSCLAVRDWKLSRTNIKFNTKFPGKSPGNRECLPRS